jgi:hypothetical protein
MEMKATCPNNPDHKRFHTVAHVSETWVVDEEGNWVETTDDPGEIVAHPHSDNTWQCVECDAEAKVEP